MGNMNQQPASDTDLIREVLAGKPRAYATLRGRYRHMVLTLGVRMLGDRELAQETTQDVFVKAFQGLESFRGDSKFSTWLYRVAYFRILDVLAREKRKRAHLDDFSLENTPEDGVNSTWAGVLEKERSEVLQRALKALSPEDNSLLSLFYLQELSLKEIGHVMGLEATVVKVRLFRARKRLKDTLDKSAAGQLLLTYER